MTALFFLLPSAWAQGVLNGDFELGNTTGWIDTSWGDIFGAGTPPGPLDILWVSSTPARDDYAGHVFEIGGYSYAWVEVTSEPFLITHTELSYARIDDPAGSEWPLQVLTDLGTQSVHVAGPTSTDAFTNWVIPLVEGACGTEGQVRLYETFGNYVGYHEYSYDDITLSGPVCAAYLDNDGDALCPLGIDLDADGQCTGAGEVFATPQDCDDGDATITACLDIIDHPPLWWQLGEPFKIVVSGANPLERVYVSGSEQQGETCPTRLGGQCLDLDRPLFLAGSAVADGNGIATIEVIAPPALDDWGADVFFQAVVDRGPSSLTSQVIATTTRPAEGPAALPGIVNGDVEHGTVGWSQAVATYPIGPYGAYACADGVQTVADTERGTSLDPQVADSAWCDPIYRTWPTVVTHEVLAFAEQGASSGVLTMRNAATDSLLAPASRLSQVDDDGWTEWLSDMSSACGQVVYFEVWAEGPSLLDDVAWTGPVCAELRDDDGDGSCTVGVDLDGDGTCVGAGEHGPGPGVELPLERVAADHEDGTDEGWGWTDTEVVTWSDLDPAYPARPGQGLAVFTPYSTLVYLEPPSPIVVTHETVALSVMLGGTGDYLYQDLQLHYPSGSTSLDNGGVLLWPGVWTQLLGDISGACGDDLTDVFLEEYDNLTLDDDSGAFFARDSWYLDDLGVLGTPCAIFTDYDGDGSCSEGLDLDLDGLCVGDGEPTPGTVQDPNEPLP